MRSRLKSTIAGLVMPTVLLAGSAVAAEFDYNYGELRWVDTELTAGEIGVGGLDTNGDGFEIGGSLELVKSVHIFGNFQTLDFGSAVDESVFEIGGGYVVPLNNGADLVARLSYIDGEIDVGQTTFDNSGFGFSAGFRNMFHPQIEGRAFMNFTDLDEAGSHFSVEVAGDYFLNDEIALGASLELGEDVTTWTLGARWYFGARR